MNVPATCKAYLREGVAQTSIPAATWKKLLIKICVKSVS